jgi:hypothetical protein
VLIRSLCASVQEEGRTRKSLSIESNMLQLIALFAVSAVTLLHRAHFLT